VFTCVVRQATLCDPIWQVTLRGRSINSYTVPLSLLLLLLLLPVVKTVSNSSLLLYFAVAVFEKRFCVVPISLGVIFWADSQKCQPTTLLKVVSGTSMHFFSRSNIRHATLTTLSLFQVRLIDRFNLCLCSYKDEIFRF